MNERTLEILVRTCVEDLFGTGWKVIAQQLALPSGRLDLLVADHFGIRNVLELKKGRANSSAIGQAIRYANELSGLLDGVSVVPWIVAHEIPPAVDNEAKVSGVKVLPISYARCEELIAAHDLSDQILLGDRRAAGVLHGGTGTAGLWETIDNRIAFSELPPSSAAMMQRLQRQDHLQVQSGKMQIALYYRGVKIGGINRKHKHCYISEGVVLRSSFQDRLASLGFRRRSKTSGVGSHEHVWWQLPLNQPKEFESALSEAIRVVDLALLLPISQ